MIMGPTQNEAFFARDPIRDSGGATYSRDIGGDRTSVSGDRSVL